MDRPYKTYDVRMARQRGHPHVHVVERCPQCYAQRSSRVAPEEKILRKAAGKWSKEFCKVAETQNAQGLKVIRYAASTGPQGIIMDEDKWNWNCMQQLQEDEDRREPAATTWAAEFLLRSKESREFLGSWMNSKATHEGAKRRATQVITCSFPCRKWLHMIYPQIKPAVRVMSTR